MGSIVEGMGGGSHCTGVYCTKHFCEIEYTACPIHYCIVEWHDLYCNVLFTDSVVFTLRGQPEEYGHALEVDDHKEVDFRR